MPLPSFRRWLTALAAVAIVIVFCILFVDRPVALFVHAHPPGFLARPLDFELAFLPLGGLAIFACGCAVLAGRALPRWAETAMLAGFAIVWATACNYFLLQPGFGRLDPAAWVEQGRYGFDLLHGRSGQGFPSGHATIAASFLGVFGLVYPRARWFVAAFVVAESAGLVLMNYHFVSDVVGGAFLGATAALMTTAVFRKRASAA